MQLTQVGKCNNCGACCYIYSQTLRRYHWCEHYSFTMMRGHCTVYGTQLRPRECAEFPRGPMDLERVAKECCIKFVDDKGRVVDGSMDKRVRLARI